MYYNTKLFEENGIEAPPAEWTKDDFLNVARAITKKDANGQTTVFGYGWTNRLWGSWMPWIFVNGGNLFNQLRSAAAALLPSGVPLQAGLQAALALHLFVIACAVTSGAIAWLFPAPAAPETRADAPSDIQSASSAADGAPTRTSAD